MAESKISEIEQCLLPIAIILGLLRCAAKKRLVCSKTGVGVICVPNDNVIPKGDGFGNPARKQEPSSRNCSSMFSYILFISCRHEIYSPPTK